MSYTKGPWKLDVKLSMRDRCQVIRGEEKPFLSKCYMNFIDTEEEIANAQLMATAPELLEEAEKIYNMLNEYLNINTNINDRWYNYFGVALGSLKETINKAKGGNQ